MYDPFGIFLFAIPILILCAWHLVFIMVRRHDHSQPRQFTPRL